MKNFSNKRRFLFRILPVIIAVAGIVLFLLYGKEITIEDILSYTPKNKLMAIIFILMMFFIKSLSVMFSSAVIYIVTGMLFTPLLAIIINIIGISIGFIYSYWAGRTSGKALKDQLIIKYPKLKQLDSIMKNNECFITFIVRTVGVLPIDVVSMFMGSMGISFKKYLVASILGTLPILLPTTFIGITITNPRSPEFILSLLFRIIFAIISMLIYRKVINKKY